jgi:hypothetical protein
MKTKRLKTYRQGDVLIEQIAELPAALQRQKPENGRIVLACGEATGHHHSIADIDAADWWKTEDGEQFLSVKTETAVEHQEHAAIVLPPSHYRVRRQREYTPEAIRNVAD